MKTPQAVLAVQHSWWMLSTRFRSIYNSFSREAEQVCRDQPESCHLESYNKSPCPLLEDKLGPGHRLVSRLTPDKGWANGVVPTHDHVCSRGLYHKATWDIFGLNPGFLVSQSWLTVNHSRSDHLRCRAIGLNKDGWRGSTSSYCTKILQKYPKCERCHLALLKSFVVFAIRLLETWSHHSERLTNMDRSTEFTLISMMIMSCYVRGLLCVYSGFKTTEIKD